jgi:hypothetical protein
MKYFSQTKESKILKYILSYLIFLFLGVSYVSAQETYTVLLKTDKGVLAGKISYTSNSFTDKLRLQSFCLLKKISEGLTCEYQDSNKTNSTASQPTVINNTNVTSNNYTQSPLTTVFLKTSNGALAGRLSYDSNFPNDVKVNSFCAYKLLTQGQTCEFISKDNPLASNPELAVRNVAPGELDTSGIWSAIGNVSNRLNNFIRTVSTVNPQVREQFNDPVVQETPKNTTPPASPSQNTPITTPSQSGGTQIVPRDVS